MSRRRSEGQMLIIALIALAMLFATVPLLLSLSSQLSKHFSSRTSQERQANVAREAFAYVSYVFESQPEAWTRAVHGDALKEFGFDGSRSFQNALGIPFTVECGRDATLFPDQLKVKVTVMYKEKSFEKTNLFQSIFSHPTMGADVRDLAHAPAALYVLGDMDLEKTGIAAPELDVQWGSIVCFGTLHLSLEPNDLQVGHHPRKFCRLGFQASRPVEDQTDHLEYWTGFPMGNPTVIDEDQYQALAHQELDPSGPRIGDGASGGDVDLPDQTIVFRRAALGDPARGTPVFYLDASVRFESEGIDLGLGAIVITHNAIFEDHKAGLPLQLHVPAHASREYPYLPEGNSFPCENRLGAACASNEALPEDGLIDFRGFLYVKGDLYINQDTVVAGVLRVDGTIHIAGGKRLTVFFDDHISHAILLKGATIKQQIISQPF